MRQEKYQQLYGSDFGEAADQLIRELGIKSRRQLWEIAGLGTNRDQWYDRVNGKAQTRKEDLDALLRGLEERGYPVTANMRKKLDASIHVVRVPDRPDRIAQLRTALELDRDDLLKRRLAEFVDGTRQQEIRDILKKIEQIKESGGYLVIRGQAGEGKTSLVAKLIATYCQPNEVAYHIIPFTPNLDHQVTLLRSLMASLALKYAYLPDYWLSIYHRDILVGIFVQMLKQLEENGDEEVIFIDGLDQIQPEGASNKRDLNFLPLVIPKGIVIVLSTRPDDTLQPLRLHSPLYPYPLPKLSRTDAASIFARFTENLGEQVIDQLYEAAQYNALYVHLIARELEQNETLSAQEIIQRISNNPNQIYDFALDRLKHPKDAWKQVLRPLLGVLLVTQEPLSLDAMLHILHLDKEEAKEGIQRLEGLVEHDSRGKYYLYHLKLGEYLRGDSQAEDAIIPVEMERPYHGQLASWCAGEDPDGGIVIWQNTNIPLEQERRVYARRYYVVHLYNTHNAQMWKQLFVVLDKGVFGHAKIREDPSMHSYALDLVLGGKAAAWEGYSLGEGLALLPSLWRYTLLRCSLNSRADQYPNALFDLLLQLGSEAEVLGLVELLIDSGKKTTILIHIALYFFQTDRPVEMRQIFLRAFEIAMAEKWSYSRAYGLSELALALAQVGEVEQAKQVCVQAEQAASSIEKDDERVKALSELAQTLNQVGEMERAKQVCAQAEQAAYKIEEGHDDMGALSELAQALAQVGEVEQAEQVAHSIHDAYNRAYALNRLAQTLAQAGEVERAKQICAQAEQETSDIERGNLHAYALNRLAQTLAQVGEVERAKQLCVQAEQEASGSEGVNVRANALYELTKILAQTGEVERAEQVANSIEESYWHAEALSRLALALAQVGEAERAKQLCAQAEQVASNIERGNERANALSRLALALAQAGKVERAEQVANSIERGNERAEALSRLALALAQAGEVERAKQVASSIEGNNERANALSELAQALAQAGEVEQAKQVCAQAEQMAHSIEENYQHVRIFITLAQTLAQVGEVERAKQVCVQAEQVASEIEGGKGRVEVLIAKVQILARAGDVDQAKKVANSIKGNDGRAEALSELAQALAQAGEVERAEQVANSIEENNQRVKTLCKLAQALAQVGKMERAKQVCVQAEQVANHIEWGNKLLEAWSVLAQTLVQIGEVERAEQVYGIQGNNMRANLLGELALTLAQAGEVERAKQVCAQAEQVAHSIEESYARVRIFIMLAQTLAQAGEVEQARELCTQAEQEASEIEDDYDRVKNLSELAQTLVRVGKVERAKQVCAQVEQAAYHIEGNYHRASALIEQARILLTLKAYGQLLHCVQWAWFQTDTREDVLQLLPLVFSFISPGTEIEMPIVESFNWVDSFLKG